MFRNPRTIGLIFDVSLRHLRDGTRLVDCLKKEVISFLRSSLEEEDGFYLYDSELTNILYQRGDQVSKVSNFNNFEIDLGFAFKQTFYVLLNEDSDYDKILLYITDRFEKNQSQHIKKVLMLNSREWDGGCRFISIGVGESYQRDILSQIEGLKHIHLEVNAVAYSLIEEFPND